MILESVTISDKEETFTLNERKRHSSLAISKSYSRFFTVKYLYSNNRILDLLWFSIQIFFSITSRIATDIPLARTLILSIHCIKEHCIWPILTRFAENFRNFNRRVTNWQEIKSGAIVPSKTSFSDSKRILIKVQTKQSLCDLFTALLKFSTEILPSNVTETE